MIDHRTWTETGWREIASERAESSSAPLKSRFTPFKIATTTVAFLFGTFVIAIVACLVTHVTFNDLIKALGSAEIRFAIELSLITSAISTALCILVAVPTAYAMSRYNFRGKSILGVMLDLPLALPPVVADRKSVV